MLRRGFVFAQAWPIILGQSLVPLAGVVNAAVIGRSSDAMILAGVALGITTVNLVFWTFGFLRMGVTGVTAQAAGAGDQHLVRMILLRALLLGFGLGVALLILSPIIVPAALSLMHLPAAAAEPGHAFTAARFFGAPAALAFYVINGWLLGVGRTRLALGCQIMFNGVNVLLNLLLVVGLGHGAWGAGLATSLSEWIALGTGLFAVRRILGGRWWSVSAGEMFEGRAYRRLIMINADIMIRTIALLAIISWFARAGARLGPVPLAANHVLMQLVSVCAFVLDGFAFTAETQIGAAFGARSRAAFLRAARLTAEFSIAGGVMFSAILALCGKYFIPLITRDAAVQAQADAMLPYCALVPLVGVSSWLLDGIFLGAAQGRTMRNVAIATAALYLATDLILRRNGADGVWIALLCSYVYRAIALGAALPRLVRQVDPDSPPSRLGLSRRSPSLPSHPASITARNEP